MSEGGKRKRGGEGGRSHKKAKFYAAPSNKASQLPLGTRGILISCQGGKETPASREAVRAVTPYYEALLSPSLAPKAENTNKDISSLIEDEVADLKDPEKQVFTYHKLGINGLVYLIMASDAPGPGPVEVVQAMAEDVQKTRQCRARLCIRFTPVEAVCYAKLEDMTQAASTVVNPHFPDGEDAEPLSYAVHYEHRASLNLDRLKVINAVIHGIPKSPHKANLSNPDFTIVVQVVKSACAMSVVRRYKEFARFNLRELSNTAENNQDSFDKPDHVQREDADQEINGQHAVPVEKDGVPDTCVKPGIAGVENEVADVKIEGGYISK